MLNPGMEAIIVVTVVCGPIGAGKSTWAHAHYGCVTDLDELSSKEEQLVRTWDMWRQGEDVAHITCLPTAEEMEFFREVLKGEVRFVWVNTTEEQCRRNILKRNRPRDMRDLERVMVRNKEIIRAAARSGLPFAFVDLFPTGERW